MMKFRGIHINFEELTEDEYDVGMDSMKVVLFLEELKIYWQIRATAEMCEEDGALADFLKRGIDAVYLRL